MKRNNGPLRDVLIVDAQNDFISGALACVDAVSAVGNIVRYLNRNQTLRTFYVMDFHPPRHCSFVEQGGAWPSHCVRNTEGCEVAGAIARGLANPEQAPQAENCFYKGENEALDEYSAFDARSPDGRRLRKLLGPAILICGMDGELCVKETATAFAAAGYDAALYVPGLAWIEERKHAAVLEEATEQGIHLIYH